MECADPAAAFGHNAGLGVNKALQKVGIFIVDNFDVRGAKIALLLDGWNGIGWSGGVHHGSCSVKHKIRRVFHLG